MLFPKLNFERGLIFFQAASQFFWMIFVLPGAVFASPWADEVFAEMDLDQKIGQLFIAPASPLAKESHIEDWIYVIEHCKVGNAIVKQATSQAQVRFLNKLQKLAPIPLFVAADAEWGLAMRMQDTIAFPKNGVLGRLGNLSWIEEVGREVSRQLKRVGVHINLAPVADVNSNSNNPVIGERSFGDDPNQVASCVAAYIRGVRSSGILACAKHFPGHGDTHLDSHLALPVIDHSRERLDGCELIPFRRAIEENVDMIMTGHLLVPSLDPLQPATLSSSCLTKLLKEELGFSGLIVSDALNMKALSKFPEEIAVEAFLAGCDLLLYGAHRFSDVELLLRDQIPRAFKALKKGFLDGSLSIDQLDQKVRKILAAKERAGLDCYQPISEESLPEDLHTKEAYELRDRLDRELPG